MLSRQEGSTTRHLASAQYWTSPAGGNTGRLFLTFDGPVCTDLISNCPLDRMYQRNKMAITHLPLGLSPQNQQNFQGRDNSLGQLIYKKSVAVVVLEKSA